MRIKPAHFAWIHVTSLHKSVHRCLLKGRNEQKLADTLRYTCIEVHTDVTSAFTVKFAKALVCLLVRLLIDVRFNPVLK